MYPRAALLTLWRLAEVTAGSPVTTMHPTENPLRHVGSLFSWGNIPPSSLHPHLPTLLFSSSLWHRSTTTFTLPLHPSPIFHLPPIPSQSSVQRPSNLHQRRSYDCRRYRKRTRGTYEGSTRTTKVTVKPIAPELSPLHQRNAPHDGNHVVIHFLRPKRQAHQNDSTICQKTTAHRTAPAPRHPSYRSRRSFRSTQKTRSRFILSSPLSV